MGRMHVPRTSYSTFTLTASVSKDLSKSSMNFFSVSARATRGVGARAVVRAHPEVVVDARLEACHNVAGRHVARLMGAARA